MTFGWVHFVVVLLVFLCEGWLLRQALRLSRRDWHGVLAPLEARFSTDVEARAGQGRGPDWEHYRNEIERCFEPIDERLRTFAAAALACGLGGTILALILHLVATGQTDAATVAWDVVAGLGVALLGSLAGVITHLFVSLSLLPATETRFQEAVDALLGQLETAARENPPRDLLSQAVRDELKELRAVLDSGVSDGLTKAMAGFPKVVESLGEHVDRLGQVIEAQSQGGTDAASEMRASAVQVATAAQAMAPAAESLAGSATGLMELPERLSSALMAARHHWIEELHDEQRQSREHLENLVEELARRGAERERELIQEIGEVTQALAGLPDRLADRIQTMSQNLGNEFGREAQHHVAGLRVQLKQEREEVLQQIVAHDREMRNNVRSVVVEVLDRISDDTHEQLTAPLAEAARALAEQTRLLAELSGRLEASRTEWDATHGRMLEGLRQAAEQIDAAAGRLATDDAHLATSAAALTDAAKAIQQVTTVSKKFERKLQKALAAITDRHLKKLEPLFGDVQKMSRTLSDDRAKVGQLMEGQSRFIQELITELTADWQAGENGRGAQA